MNLLVAGARATARCPITEPPAYSLTRYWEHIMSLEDRFWSKVQKSEGCWEWTGARFKTGYGAITIGSKLNNTKRAEYAHRVLWTLAVGEIPGSMCVLHRCDNPPCVRPDHLFLGSKKDNARDMVEKNRWWNMYKDNPPTKCKRGHEFSAANTSISSKGTRRCRQCNAMWTRIYKRRKREALASG